MRQFAAATAVADNNNNYINNKNYIDDDNDDRHMNYVEKAIAPVTLWIAEKP